MQPSKVPDEDFLMENDPAILAIQRKLAHCRQLTKEFSTDQPRNTSGSLRKNWKLS